DVREHGSGHEPKAAQASRAIFIEDVGSRDVARHQVGRELDAIRAQGEGAAERGDEQRLRETGHAHEQPVPARKDAREEQLDARVRSDDTLLQLAHDAPTRLAELTHAIDIALLGGRGRFKFGDRLGIAEWSRNRHEATRAYRLSEA